MAVKAPAKKPIAAPSPAPKARTVTPSQNALTTAAPRAPAPQSKAVAKPTPQSTALAPLDDLSEMASGLDQVSSTDLLIPRITILQKMSPQLEKSAPEFNADAMVGDFCDVATGDIFRDELIIIPCYFVRVYLEWAPRASKKGLVKNHGTDASILNACERDEKGRYILDNGNYIAETATWFVLNMSAGGRRSFMPLSSTALKSSRQWMTMITSEKLERSDGKQFVPPIFYRSWKATVTERSNAEGNWMTWKFEPGPTIFELDPGKALLLEAREYMEQAKAGVIKGDFGSGNEEEMAVNSGKVIDGGAM